MVFASYSSASMQRLVSKFSGFGGTEACIAYMATTPASNNWSNVVIAIVVAGAAWYMLVYRKKKN